MLEVFWLRSTFTHAPPVLLDLTSTSPFSAWLLLYQKKYWSNSSVTLVAADKFSTGVMSCSSGEAELPALSLSTIATGASSGSENVRLPGLAVVHVAAAPPPEPPSTTVQDEGMPEENASFRAVPGRNRRLSFRG